MDLATFFIFIEFVDNQIFMKTLFKDLTLHVQLKKIIYARLITTAVYCPSITVPSSNVVNLITTKTLIFFIYFSRARELASALQFHCHWLASSRRSVLL